VLSSGAKTDEEIVYAVKWCMRDRVDDQEVRYGFAWDELHELFENATHQHKIGRGRSIGFWPKVPHNFRQIIVKRSVRVSSKDCDHTGNSEAAEDIHEICG
jgi:hypothetical protein